MSKFSFACFTSECPQKCAENNREEADRVSGLTRDSNSKTMRAETDVERRVNLWANKDLAAKWGTIIRYMYQAGKSFGLLGAELREIFQYKGPDELEHAAFLTDVIIDLGGEPTTMLKEFAKPESLRAMLELDIDKESKYVANHTQWAKQAEELGEIELKVKLEEIAADEAGHARELRRLLKGL
jgi:bacterioferritin